MALVLFTPTEGGIPKNTEPYNEIGNLMNMMKKEIAVPWPEIPYYDPSNIYGKKEKELDPLAPLHRAIKAEPQVKAFDTDMAVARLGGRFAVGAIGGTVAMRGSLCDLALAAGSIAIGDVDCVDTVDTDWTSNAMKELVSEATLQLHELEEDLDRSPTPRPRRGLPHRT